MTPQSVDAYAAAIDRALRHANADARANGEKGNYAVAARNAFEGTVAALAEGHRLFAESGRCFLTNYL